MAKQKRKGKAIHYKGYLHLHAPPLQCRDFISLKGNSIKLLIDIGQQYNGYNNGDLCATLSVMRRRGWNSNQQLSKALKELQEKKRVHCTDCSTRALLLERHAAFQLQVLFPG